jgi:hypothetical protein
MSAIIPPFEWNQTYSDPVGYNGRIIRPGYNDCLWDASGKPWSYIKLQPPVSGTGRLDFRCDFTVIVMNPNLNPVKVRCALGVGSVILGPKPMYPYLGVNHGQIGDLLRYVTVQPHAHVMISGFRKDIVDEALQGDQPIPGWPNWTMANGEGGVPPFVGIQFVGDPVLSVNVIVENALGECR